MSSSETKPIEYLKKILKKLKINFLDEEFNENLMCSVEEKEIDTIIKILYLTSTEGPTLINNLKSLENDFQKVKYSNNTPIVLGYDNEYGNTNKSVKTFQLSNKYISVIFKAPKILSKELKHILISKNVIKTGGIKKNKKKLEFIMTIWEEEEIQSKSN
jgi:hypothetical protein